MATKNTDRLGVYLPPHLKRDLKAMSDETGYTVNQLALMSLTSLLANYNQRGCLIFVDLLSSRKYRKTKG
ncbi:hypothetical protein [Bacillus sp. ISL-46]|uniref:hypothetical protein n=1 Tax=Bacillus sp. ISL-46 TaxID=2819129 RepID=UPI001BE59968|nr:hypothetical protein [Bacillus sp. ISL-46]MBT2721425.1 hypothetical protein [Bacillus sp. ISL-46]